MSSRSPNNPSNPFPNTCSYLLDSSSSSTVFALQRVPNSVTFKWVSNVEPYLKLLSHIFWKFENANYTLYVVWVLNQLTNNSKKPNKALNNICLITHNGGPKNILLSLFHLLVSGPTVPWLSHLDVDREFGREWACWSRLHSVFFPHEDKKQKPHLAIVHTWPKVFF